MEKEVKKVDTENIPHEKKLMSFDVANTGT